MSGVPRRHTRVEYCFGDGSYAPLTIPNFLTPNDVWATSMQYDLTELECHEEDNGTFLHRLLARRLSSRDGAVRLIECLVYLFIDTHSRLDLNDHCSRFSDIWFVSTPNRYLFNPPPASFCLESWIRASSSIVRSNYSSGVRVTPECDAWLPLQRDIFRRNR